MTDLTNIEAEQALLGAALLNNDVVDAVADRVTLLDFAEPAHQAIWERITTRVGRGDLASPVTIKGDLAPDVLADLGGPAYLARLAGAAVSLFACRDYAKLIGDLARKRRLAAAISEAGAALEDPDQDVTSVLGKIEAFAMLEERRGGGQVVPFMAAITEALREAQAAHTSDGLPGVTTGLAALDSATGGFMPGQFVILAGRPGMGKSAIALSAALGAARAGRSVAICSLEMSMSEIGIRAISEGTARTGRGVAYHDARRGEMSDSDADRLREAASSIAGLPIYLTPPECRDVGAMLSALRQIKRKAADRGQPLALVVVDYLQLVEASRARGNRQEEVSEVSAAMKALARRLDVPVLALSQLNRAVENRDDKRPHLGDLRESGALEQDADIVIFAFRQEYYLRREKPEEHEHEKRIAWSEAIAACSGKLDLIIAKQRMGECKSVRVLFDERTNWTRDWSA